jgi:hypothetical protein
MPLNFKDAADAGPLNVFVEWVEMVERVDDR